MQQRRLRLLVVEALERHVAQFRAREELWPFRVPHEPLPLDEIVERALAGEQGWVTPDELRSRSVLSFEWDDGSRWSAWVIALPAGISLYCDTDHEETRVLGSVKRGSALEADRLFLELLAVSRGHAFGIELQASAPDRVRTRLTDRALLTDVFVDLFEGTEAERAIHQLMQTGYRRRVADAPDGRDFTSEIARWLDRVLVTPAAPKRAGRRSARLADVRARRA